MFTRFATYAVFSLSIIVISSFSVHAQSRGEGRPDNKTQVIVAPLNYQAQESNIESVGTAEAVQSIIIYPAVSERVTSLNFSPGQEVKQGDVLLSLYNEREKVALERAQIQLKDAKREYQRLLDSRKSGAAAQSLVDVASTQVALSEVAVRDAQVALNERIVIAPFTGIVGFTDVEVGDRISQQTPVTTLDNRQSLYVNFTAPEVAVPMLASSPSVILTPWQDRTLDISAKIAQVDSRINEQDRTIRVRALLDNNADTYRPGMSFRVKLSVRGENYVSIPEAAMLWSATGAYVWQMVDGKAQRVDVQIQQRLRGTILVSGAFNENAALVVEGVQRLRQNQAIEGLTATGAAS